MGSNISLSLTQCKISSSLRSDAPPVRRIISLL
jgi:hypothetical protein